MLRKCEMNTHTLFLLFLFQPNTLPKKLKLYSNSRLLTK